MLRAKVFTLKRTQKTTQFSISNIKKSLERAILSGKPPYPLIMRNGLLHENRKDLPFLSG
jgi:hypothetical protein